MKKVKEYYIYFVLYAIIGWIYEVVLELFFYSKQFVNRGFLYGPYLPVYGFGAIIILLTVTKLKEKEIKIGKLNITPVLVFISIFIITSLVELVASYFLDFIGKPFSNYWYYSPEQYPINFQGRVAAFTSLRFAIGGTIFIYGLQPLFEKFVKKLSDKKLNIVFICLLSIVLIDLVLKIISFIR